MGFMSLESVVESDNAADLAFSVAEAVAVILEKGLAEKANCYNTTGPVNVALVFEEMILPLETSVYPINDRLVKVATKCVSLLQKEKKLASNEFSKDYDRMISNLKSYIVLAK